MAAHRSFLPPVLSGNSGESRHPSPGPTHLSVPGQANGGRNIITDSSIGYEAPKFEGKEQQMNAGKQC